MKKVLFAGLLAIAGVSVSAQNLIKNEKFATEVKTKVTNANKATAGEWFIMNNEADGATTIAWEQTGDAKYPNAMKIDNSGAEKNISWYKAFLGMRKRMITVSTILLSSCVEIMMRTLNQTLRVHNITSRLRMLINGLK